MCDSKDNSGVSEKCGKKFTNYPLNTTPTSLNYNLPEISKNFITLRINIHGMVMVYQNRISFKYRKIAHLTNIQ